MSYGLLWIETLALTLLWVAALTAVAARIRRRLVYALLVLVIFLLPLAPLALLSLMTALPRLIDHMAMNNSFGYCLALTICFIIGVIVLLRYALRAADTPTGRAAAAWPRGRLLLALAVAAVIWTMTIWNIELEARAQLAAMRAEAGSIMLSVMPPTLNDDQNAALVYEKAFKRLDADPVLKQKENPLTQDKPEANDPAVLQFLAGHTQTIALIKKAAQLPDCYFEHDYIHPSISMLIPEYGKLRQSARLLRLHALREAAQGRPEAAVDDINAMFRIATHSERMPLLVAGLISIAIDGQAVGTLEEILPSLRSPEAVQNARLNDPERVLRVMRRSMLSEEAFGMACFCDIMGGVLRPADLGLVHATGMGRRLTMDIWPEGGGVFLRLLVMGDDAAHYRAFLERYRSLFGRPYFQIYEEVQKLDRSGQSEPGVCTRLLMPAMSRAARMIAGGVARLETARVALAVTRYRMEKGEAPATVKSLVPAYLPETPLDPFDGKPLRMKLAGDKLLIYSVGPDLKDDGGADYTKDPKPLTGDIVFSVKLK